MRIEYAAKTTAYRVCAWCSCLLGVKSWPSVWEESTITHGVCETCMRQLLHRTRSDAPANGGVARGPVDPTAEADEMSRSEWSEPAPVW
jgi:hypothetical protein